MAKAQQLLCQLYVCPHNAINRGRRHGPSAIEHMPLMWKLTYQRASDSHYYMCPHTTITTIYVSSYYYMCPHATVYVSSHYYICVLILLYMCPHATIPVSSCYTCVLMRLHVSSYCYKCVLILLHTQGESARSGWFRSELNQL